MDSEFDSHLQPLPDSAKAGASSMGGWRRVLERVQRYRRDRSRRPVRFVSLDWRRVVGLAILLSLLVSAATVAAIWHAHRKAAASAAHDTVARVERRLGEINAEIDRLEADLGPPDSALACSTATSMALARATMKSVLVQQFSVMTGGQAQACYPDGPGPALADPPMPAGQLALYSTGQIAVRLMAIRAVGAGRVVTAMLDGRGFDRRAMEDDGERATLSAINTALLSADGRRLIDLSDAGRDNPPITALGALAPSRQYGAMVQANVSVSGLWAAAGAGVLTALVITWVLLVAVVALAWRSTRLRSLQASRIERGLRKRQFEPFVQPIIDLATGRCSGGEILMRWAHPERGVLAPGEFIEEAERSRLIVGMSDLVMDRAAHRLAKIAAEQPNFYFSFNITATQLRQRRFKERLDELFHGQTIPQAQVLLELTEREFVGATGARVLKRLHAAGWRIAVDDFGTGQSSLAALEQLPIDRIKIDISFVRAIGEQTVNRPVLDAIIALANQLRVPMIAEGVETERQWEYLSERGVQYAQGYLIGRPMPIDVFGQWLADYQAASNSTSAGAPVQPLRAQTPTDVDARQLWNRLRSRGGLDVRDRIYWLRPYRQCFIGREAVDWMVRQLGVQRTDAVQIGKRMAALGLLEHVMQEHDFEDANLYYRLASSSSDEPAAPPMGSDLRTAITEVQGVVMGDHSRGVVRHRQCNTGTAIIDWISKRYEVPRPTALQWASQLMRRGVVRHVYDDQPMRDDRSLYRVM